MFLLDTNTIIYFLKGTLPSNAMHMIGDIADSIPGISVITKIELLGFNTSNINEEEFAREFIKGSYVYNLNDAIVDQTIALRKQYRIKLPDAIIAATAIVYNLTIITHNIEDFDNIINLQCIDPYLL